MCYTVLSEEQNSAVLQAVVSLRMYVSASIIQALRAGTIKVPLTKLSLRGTPKWRNHQVLPLDLMAAIVKQ